MDKAKLRRAVIARRDAIDLDVRAAKSAVICARLAELLGRLDAAAPHTVAVYAAMGSEVDSAAFAAAAAKRGWRVAYPCMLSATDAAACGQRMCMRAVAADDASAAPFIAHPTRAFAAMDIPHRACRSSRHDRRTARGLRPNRRAPGLRRRLLRSLPAYALARMPNYRHRL